jgi:hypothetical protein
VASCYAFTFTNLSGSVDLQFFFATNGTATDGATKTTVRPSDSATGTAAESGMSWEAAATF